MTLLSEVHARSNLTISAFTLLDLDSFEQRIDAVQRLWRSTEESVVHVPSTTHFAVI